MAKKKLSPKYSFKGFSIKRLIIGQKKSLIAVLGIILSNIGNMSPTYALWISSLGITATGIYSIIEFYCSEVKLE